MPRTTVPQPPRNPRARRPPTEAQILDTALALVDAGGPEAGTVRRIAAALDAPANAVYRVFPDRAAIVSALLDRLLGEVDEAAAGPGDWAGQVEELALTLRGRLTAHPGAVPMLMTVPLTGPNAARLGERVRDLIAGAGLPGEDVGRGARVVTVYVFGAITLGDGTEDLRWGLRRVLSGLRTPI
jgi:TetR/AcrR family tetracycline transcriptional repressor